MFEESNVQLILLPSTTQQQKMKAAIYKKYGPPEVVYIEEVQIPEPKENEVLVKVWASTVNRTDTGFRSAEYVISRFWSGLFRPKNQILGCEFAGIVEKVGSQVNTFKAGDHVFGFNDKTWGGHAEFMTISEDAGIAICPKNIDLTTCAALTEGAHYAMNYLNAVKISNQHKVLVYGATGAIGSAAVQLLKHFGAYVVAVSNSKNVELVKSLGAEVVIDYQTEDYTKIDQKFDFFLDAVGKSSFKIAKKMLVDKGIYCSTELGKNGQNVFYALFTPLFGSKKVLFPIPKITKERLEFIRKVAESGEYTPVIDRTYSLDEIVEAHRYVGSGQKTGSVLIQIGGDI